MDDGPHASIVVRLLSAASISRFRRITASLAIVVSAYWTYDLLAVPFIEPPADRPISRRPDGKGETTEEFGKRQRESIRPLFPSDAWELQNPTILESNRAKLIFQQYQNHPDGRVEIHPCAIVFPYDGPARDEDQLIRQSIVLEAPGGAVLQFDPPLDLRNPKLGRLVGGQLVGPITIRSGWKEPGPEDDLLITTRDAELSERAVSTPHPVDFRWGPHVGRGRDMIIKLLRRPSTPGAPVTGPNIAGIELFEMRHIEHLHFDLGQTDPGRTPKQPSIPVEIRCRGPFRFDVLRRVATFRDSVDVMKLNPTGPADQIACEQLSLFFVGRSETKFRRNPSALPAQAQDPNADPSKPATPAVDLVAQRLEARGNPVVLTAPSQTLSARGSRMEYNLLTNAIALEGGQEVFLQQSTNEIHARSLRYQSAGEGRLGQAQAEGPGWLRGQLADRTGRQLEAAWRDQLRIVPDGQNHVISLTGDAALNCPGTGQLQAREILFWLTELPSPNPRERSRLQPNRMLARNAVRMNSPQLSGEVEQLEVRFQETDRGSLQNQVMPRGSQNAFGASQARPNGAQPPAIDAERRGGTPPGTPATGLLAQPNASQRFKIIGRVLRADVLLDGQQSGVSHLLVEDGVRFVEDQPPQPGAQQPMQILGDRLELTDATGMNAIATVTGRPARCEGRGMGLTATNINLDRGANRFWIEGSGQMDLPLPSSTPGQPPAGPLTVTWQRGMVFDGQTATFGDSVAAATGGNPPRQELRTQTMAVQLRRQIQFSDPNAQGQPEIETIVCRGGVWMGNRTFDQQGQQLSWEQLQVPDVQVNVQNGQAAASGPGWLHSVRRGSTNPLGPPGTTAPPASTAQPQASLVCLHVTFEAGIRGTLPVAWNGGSSASPVGSNAPLLNLSFGDRVRAAYDHVDRWDAQIPVDDPAKLGPQGMTACCNQLQVAEILVPGAATRTGEVIALGNAAVEGARGTFKACGYRIGYDASKDMLVLEGDGRSAAELMRQLQPGAEPQSTKAQKILYWPKTQAVRTEGLKAFGVPQLPVGAGLK
ncbi:MAG: hypothetical protein LLG00_11505 [Planctomycetaceae bacterium]|nr:hypothetical protein [Planctomycetaceae bacterium]